MDITIVPGQINLNLENVLIGIACLVIALAIAGSVKYWLKRRW